VIATRLLVADNSRLFYHARGVADPWQAQVL